MENSYEWKIKLINKYISVSDFLILLKNQGLMGPEAIISPSIELSLSKSIYNRFPDFMKRKKKHSRAVNKLMTNCYVKEYLKRLKKTQLIIISESNNYNGKCCIEIIGEFESCG